MFGKGSILCHHETGRNCFAKHVSSAHDLPYKVAFTSKEVTNACQFVSLEVKRKKKTVRAL